MVPLTLGEGRWSQGYHQTEPLFLSTNENASVLYASATTIPATPISASYRSTWGARRDPLYIVIPITIIYAIIFLTGVIGNVSTCIVIARNKSMHTATNYYLFSLAVSDLLLLVSGLPPEMYYIWSHFPYVFGEVFCVIQGFAAETSANATVLTITAFTIERYVAICHPFLSHTMSKLTRAIKFVIAIWLVALCLAIPQAVSFGIVYETSVDGGIPYEDHYVCGVKRIVIPHAFEISTFLFFVAPMTLITVLYVLIALQLRRSSVIARGGAAGSSVSLKARGMFKRKERTATEVVAVMLPETAYPQVTETVKADDGRKNYSKNVQAKATKHVVKMLVAVVVAFFICWAPFHAQRLLAMYGTHSAPHMVAVFSILTYVSGVLYYLSTTINPLLYHIMSNKFREAFKETLAGICGHGRRARRRAAAEGAGVGRCYSVLSGRFSQNNSTSGTSNGGCCGDGLRYFETDIMTFREFRRPMVVSFRRRNTFVPKLESSPSDTVSDNFTATEAFETDLQKALTSLADESKSRCQIRSRRSDSGRSRNNMSLHVISRESAALGRELCSESVMVEMELKGKSSVVDKDGQKSSLISQDVLENGYSESNDAERRSIGEQPSVFDSDNPTNNSDCSPKVEDIEIFQDPRRQRTIREQPSMVSWCFARVEDIEIFQEQCLVMRTFKRTSAECGPATVNDLQTVAAGDSIGGSNSVENGVFMIGNDITEIGSRTSRMNQIKECCSFRNTENECDGVSKDMN